MKILLLLSQHHYLQDLRVPVSIKQETTKLLLLKLGNCRPMLHKSQWLLNGWSNVMLTTSSLETDNIVVMYHIHKVLRKALYMLWLNVVEHMISTNAYWNGTSLFYNMIPIFVWWQHYIFHGNARNIMNTIYKIRTYTYQHS